jgi:hypothetical protein
MPCLASCSGCDAYAAVVCLFIGFRGSFAGSVWKGLVASSVQRVNRLAYGQTTVISCEVTSWPDVTADIARSKNPTNKVQSSLANAISRKKIEGGEKEERSATWRVRERVRYKWDPSRK